MQNNKMMDKLQGLLVNYPSFFAFTVINNLFISGYDRKTLLQLSLK